MNERIKELIERSYVEVPHERDWDATSKIFDKELFAELIIKECCEVADESEQSDFKVSKFIKLHFDIES